MDRTNVRNNACYRLNVVGTHFQGVPNFASFLGRLGEVIPTDVGNMRMRKTEHYDAQRAPVFQTAVYFSR